jgi:hypothetical protein
VFPDCGVQPQEIVCLVEFPAPDYLDQPLLHLEDQDLAYLDCLR